jgi:hypothetical protein
MGFFVYVQLLWLLRRSEKEAAGNGPRGTASPVPVFPEQGSYGFLHLWIEAVGSAFFLGVGFVDSQLFGYAGQRFIWVFCG